MSYTDGLKIDDYQVVKNWNSFISDSLKSNSEKILMFYNLIVETNVTLRSLPLFVSFQYCFFKKDVEFSGEFAESVSFHECYFDGAINANQTVFKQDFTFDRIYCKNKIEIFRGAFVSCNWIFRDAVELSITGGKYERLNISTRDAIMRNLSLGSSIEGNITIFDASIEKIGIIGLSKDSNLFMRNIQVSVLKFLYYRNDGRLSLSNVSTLRNSSSTIFSVAKSYLGKAEFYDVDFSLFEVVNFNDVALVDCSFISIKWKFKIISGFENFYLPKLRNEERRFLLELHLVENNFLHISNIAATAKKLFTVKNKLLVVKKVFRRLRKKHELKDDPISKKYFQKNREIYRQLKYALSKQGDVVNEQRFHSKEMLAYNNSLRWYSKDFGTKLIINLSSITSDFGQSIFRPLWTLLVIHTLLYLLAYNLGAIATQHWGDTIFTYFQLINPLHPNDISPGKSDTYHLSLKGGFILIDLAMRVSSSYMIYNIIRASRRFIK